jgi:hypothetical protein
VVLGRDVDAPRPRRVGDQDLARARLDEAGRVARIADLEDRLRGAEFHAGEIAGRAGSRRSADRRRQGLAGTGQFAL